MSIHDIKNALKVPFRGSLGAYQLMPYGLYDCIVAALIKYPADTSWVFQGKN